MSTHGFRYTVFVIEGRDYTSEGHESIEYRGKDGAEALTVANAIALKGDTRVRIVIEYSRS